MDGNAFGGIISLAFEEYERNYTCRQWNLVTLAEYH